MKTIKIQARMSYSCTKVKETWYKESADNFSLLPGSCRDQTTVLTEVTT